MYKDKENDKAEKKKRKKETKHACGAGARSHEVPAVSLRRKQGVAPPDDGDAEEAARLHDA